MLGGGGHSVHKGLQASGVMMSRISRKRKGNSEDNGQLGIFRRPPAVQLLRNNFRGRK